MRAGPSGVAVEWRSGSSSLNHKQCVDAWIARTAFLVDSRWRAVAACERAVVWSAWQRKVGPPEPYTTTFVVDGWTALYASSASVYGAGPEFREERGCEAPLNIYGYSKFLFDQYVRKALPRRSSQVAGFRYFNVYGPNEQHKGRMASVAFHAYQQLLAAGKVKLFVGSDGYGDGEQRRDFVHVDDVVDVNLWFLEHRDISGVYNCGTGRAQSFNQLAAAVINAVQGTQWPVRELVARGLIEYIAFPPQLVGKYQSFTQADLTRLRTAGYVAEFMTVEQGASAYVKELQKT